MHKAEKLKGWMLLIYTLFLGPFFPALYYQRTRYAYPFAGKAAWLLILIMFLCAWPMFTFMFSPVAVAVVYALLFISGFGLTFFYCWSLDAKTRVREPKDGLKLSLSGAFTWMIIMSTLFAGLSNIVRAICYWLFGELVAVHFSSYFSPFQYWAVIGMVYGFTYGIKPGNDYFSRTWGAVGKMILMVFIFIFLYSACVLLLVIYPLQRLVPISYFPQLPEYMFYFLLLMAILLSAVYLLRAAVRSGTLKGGLLLLFGIPLVACHIMIISTYSVTINLAIASILEERHNIEAAKTIYTKAIPYVKHDRLLVSLHHRQGVLNVLNQDYKAAEASFKKVLADYSEKYEAFRKARRYMTAYETHGTSRTHNSHILKVKHHTFEQAASCFPNSLSVILNFYGDKPISTRSLSYAIKEDFSSGTFIWKAESFLEKNGYELITTFWQNKETLISLLDAGYPILMYVPGHVYTLYGYDTPMEMFFTYDTVNANRWSDKPYWSLQRDWMRSGFSMSVVVAENEKAQFIKQFPQLERLSVQYRLWQKAQISTYYESKGNFWQDYDRYALSKTFGLDRLKRGEDYFFSKAYFDFPWDEKHWNMEIFPVLNESWALEWPVLKGYLLYLLDNGHPEKALELIAHYQSHMKDDEDPPDWVTPSLLELKLAATLHIGKQQEAVSISDKLIGMAGNSPSISYWGHYFKARNLIETGKLDAAVELLLPVLDDIYLNYAPESLSVKYILDALNEINQKDSSLIGPQKASLKKVMQIYFAS